MARRWMFIGVGLVAVVLLFLLYGMQPKEINWNTHYLHDSSDPWGTEILYESWGDLFPESELKRSDRSALSVLNDSLPEGSIFVSIGSDLWFESLNEEALLAFVERGNTAFLSSADWYWSFLDTLNVRQTYSYNYLGGDSLIYFGLYEDDTTYSLFAPTVYTDYRGLTTDTSSIDVLGHGNTLADTIFMRIPFGKGQIFLHSQPKVFTNYNLTEKENYKYTAACLSYLPDGYTLWDTYHINGEHGTSRSPMRFVLQEPALKWAWLLLFFGTVLLLIYLVKREQRSIPVVKPYENTTLQFAEIVGNLYYNEGDHADLIQKQITYFMHNLRDQFHVDIPADHASFVSLLTARSGRPRKKVEKLTQMLLDYQESNKATSDDVVYVHQQIENFLNHNTK